jgi:hypothetical protein
MRFFLSFLFAIVLSGLNAQTGTIRGKVVEDATNETLIGATIQIPGTTVGTITDLDGNFTIKIAPGNYSLKVSYISYNDILIEDVVVKSDEVTVVSEARLQDADLKLNEIVITAEAVRTTEVALMSIRKNSQTMMDGISSAKMSLTGDATAVEAVKRVTGVSIEGGKYVYVRGLGDRYSKTMMNNADIPGLDPDRNTIQMDIFPSNLISNMTISKTFTADLPADFTGGLINIETVDFPERKKIKVSLGASYNPNMNLKSDFIDYKGGSFDFLGFDDGTRSLPNSARGDVPRPYYNPSSEVYNFVTKFNPTMGVEEKTSFLNTSLSVSMGNQLDLGEDNSNRKLGYIFSFSYKNDYEYYDNVFYGDYQKDGDNSDVYDLIYADKKNGQIGEQSTLMGVLGGVAYKTQLSKYRFTAMHLQKGTSTASHMFKDNNPEAVGQSGYTAISEVLNYNQSSLTNLLFTGKYILQEKGWEIDWRVAPTYSYSADPDIRQTSFSIYQGEYKFSSGEGGLPTRTWRYLKELNTVAKVDIIKKYSFLGEDAKLRFGGAYTIKYRDYEILKYNIKFTELQHQPDWPIPDPNLVLQDENIFSNGLVYIDGGVDGPNPNEYQSNNQTIAFYTSNDFNLLPSLKAIVGLRVENFVQRHTGRDILFSQGNLDGLNLDNEKVLESFDFFPSLNLIWNVAEEQNLRFAYSNTIARPSFKEVSFAQIADPITNIIFNGALYGGYSDWDGNIQETRINNFDARYEFFMDKGQIISVSGFAKFFNKPIEIVRIPEAQASIEIQPRNVGDGMLLGGEFEFVKNLKLISPFLENISLNGNFTYVYSKIAMTDSEFEARKEQERDGETVKDYRPMAGQAPWVVNAGLVYLNRDLGLDIGAFYNVKGPTLTIVGLGIFPDVYTVPFHSLNFSATKKFGKENRMSLGVKVSNILNDKKEELFNSYKASDVYSLIKEPGSTFSLGFSYKF